MVYVIIDCFTGIWKGFAFQYAPLMQIRGGDKVRFNSLTLHKLGALLYLITETCEISLVCRKL